MFFNFLVLWLYISLFYFFFIFRHLSPFAVNKWNLPEKPCREKQQSCSILQYAVEHTSFWMSGVFFPHPEAKFSQTSNTWFFFFLWCLWFFFLLKLKKNVHRWWTTYTSFTSSHLSYTHPFCLMPLSTQSFLWASLIPFLSRTWHIFKELPRHMLLCHAKVRRRLYFLFPRRIILVYNLALFPTPHIHLWSPCLLFKNVRMPLQRLVKIYTM